MGVLPYSMVSTPNCANALYYSQSYSNQGSGSLQSPTLPVHKARLHILPVKLLRTGSLRRLATPPHHQKFLLFLAQVTCRLHIIRQNEVDYDPQDHCG